MAVYGHLCDEVAVVCAHPCDKAVGEGAVCGHLYGVAEVVAVVCDLLP